MGCPSESNVTRLLAQCHIIEKRRACTPVFGAQAAEMPDVPEQGTRTEHARQDALDAPVQQVAAKIGEGAEIDLVVRRLGLGE